MEYNIEGNVITFGNVRISILNSRLVRLECSQSGHFEDRCTQSVCNRFFDSTDFTCGPDGDFLTIDTGCIHVETDGRMFSRSGLLIFLEGKYSTFPMRYRYGDKIDTLKGTARTLDCCDGECQIEEGIISRNGFSIMDDSYSMVIDETGWFTPREKGIKDIYFWGYGHDYRDAISDLLRLTGKVPLLSRFVFGNWWSRYYRYSAASYLGLMDEFKRRNIPFSVAVIDMDWHLVDIDRQYGSGWTGYTWNRALFPDPKAFLASLHERGLHVTLNEHPADGIRAFESGYEAMCDLVGKDPDLGEAIPFDVSGPQYLDALDKAVLEPMENDGVDFWWVDWQQGDVSRLEGLDPLWVLNRHRYEKARRNGRRPLTFSRFAGIGSQRYPIGFSGDTIVTWKSLDFQPYFTATAANVGYFWWSHDIGGHMGGYLDEELEARWYQLGVFSPIMRLHSSSTEFFSKEPWRYSIGTERIMEDFLRLRHRLIPYLYSMNHRAAEQGIPLCEPMYYGNPESNPAYRYRNEYRFGSELIVAPITGKNIPELDMGKVEMFLPEGRYYDIFTNVRYEGGRELTAYRRLEHYPVFAKEGSILILSDDLDALKNPENLEVIVYYGQSGSFELYEDDGESEDYLAGKYATTTFTYDQRQGRLTISPAEGDRSCIPPRRNYRIKFVGAEGNGKNELSFELADVETDKGTELVLPNDATARNNDTKALLMDLLQHARIDYWTKSGLWEMLESASFPYVITALMMQNISEDLRKAMLEILLA